MVITTGQPNPALIHNLANPNFAVLQVREGMDLTRPVMTGPYRVVSFQPDQAVVVEKNPTYWGAPAGFERITLKTVPDPNTRAMALQSGEVQVATDLPVEMVSAVAQRPDLQVESVVGLRTYSLHFNLRKPPFDDVRVRRAVSLAIDREALAKSVLMGYATPATSIFPPSLPFGGLPAAPVSDPKAEARKLLDEAGWTVGSNGVRTRGNQPLAVTLLSYPQRQELNLMAEAIQSFLAEVGVQVKVQVVQDITAELEKAAYDFAIMNQMTAPSADPMPTRTWTSWRRSWRSPLTPRPATTWP